MSHRLTVSALCLGALLSSLGCGILKKKVDDAAPSATAATASAAPAVTSAAPTADAPVAAAAPAVDDSTVPATEDFEDEAFQKVTAANFKAQLTQLTTDINAPAK